MIYGMYSVRDFKTGFLTPTVDVNDAAAQRNFESAVRSRPDSLFFTHPQDYALYKIGEYDTDSGVVSPVVPVYEIVSAAQVLDVKEV